MSNIARVEVVGMVAMKNPLAAGVYWLDVFRPFGSSTVHDQDVDFGAWLGNSHGAVKVLRRETRNVIPGELASGENRDRVNVWYLFEVTAQPAAFPFDKLGFPEIVKLASSGITPADRATQAKDTEQVPEPEGLPDLLKPIFDGASSSLTLLLFGFALYELARRS